MISRVMLLRCKRTVSIWDRYVDELYFFPFHHEFTMKEGRLFSVHLGCGDVTHTFWWGPSWPCTEFPPIHLGKASTSRRSKAEGTSGRWCSVLPCGSGHEASCISIGSLVFWGKAPQRRVQQLYSNTKNVMTIECLLIFSVMKLMRHCWIFSWKLVQHLCCHLVTTGLCCALQLCGQCLQKYTASQYRLSV